MNFCQKWLNYFVPGTNLSLLFFFYILIVIHTGYTIYLHNLQESYNYLTSDVIWKR